MQRRAWAEQVSEKIPKKNPVTRVSAKAPSQADFEHVLSLIDAARTRAVAAVNTALIDLYWTIGEHISGKIAGEGWGQGTVNALAEYIQRGSRTRGAFRLVISGE